MVRPTLLDLRLINQPDRKVLVLCRSSWLRVAYIVTDEVRERILARADVQQWLIDHPGRTVPVQFHNCGTVKFYPDNKIHYFQTVFVQKHIDDVGRAFPRPYTGDNTYIPGVSPVDAVRSVYPYPAPLRSAPNYSYSELTTAQQTACALRILRHPSQPQRATRALAPLRRPYDLRPLVHRDRSQRPPTAPRTPERTETPPVVLDNSPRRTPPVARFIRITKHYPPTPGPLLAEDLDNSVLGAWIASPPGFERAGEEHGSPSNPFVFVDPSSDHCV